jgi:hypothetical protein
LATELCLFVPAPKVAVPRKLLNKFGVPKQFEFELSPEMLAKSDALTREIANINKGLGLGSDFAVGQNGATEHRLKRPKSATEDAAFIPPNVFEPG